MDKGYYEYKLLLIKLFGMDTTKRAEPYVFSKIGVRFRFRKRLASSTRVHEVFEKRFLIGAFYRRSSENKTQDRLMHAESSTQLVQG